MLMYPSWRRLENVRSLLVMAAVSACQEAEPGADNQRDDGQRHDVGWCAGHTMSAE
jgi:hypothetical protein